MKAGGFMKNKQNEASVEIEELLNNKINELIDGQKELEKNIFEILNQNNKIIMKRINKIIENCEILEMQNETIAKEVRNINKKIL